MIKIYTNSNNRSSKNAVNWLTNQNLQFKEIKINKEGISKQNLLEILKVSSNGLDIIISKQSNSYAALADKIEDLTLSEFIRIAQGDRRLLKWPIIIDGEKLQVGFHTNQMTIFLSI